ncbi:hypothetical protein D3C72_869670 [compost metagenome]
MSYWINRAMNVNSATPGEAVGLEGATNEDVPEREREAVARGRDGGPAVHGQRLPIARRRGRLDRSAGSRHRRGRHPGVGRPEPHPRDLPRPRPVGEGARRALRRPGLGASGPGRRGEPGASHLRRDDGAAGGAEGRWAAGHGLRRARALGRGLRPALRLHRGCGLQPRGNRGALAHEDALLQGPRRASAHEAQLPGRRHPTGPRAAP